MAEYWDSKGNIHRDFEYEGKSNTAVETALSIGKSTINTTAKAAKTATLNPMLGGTIIAEKTISLIYNRNTRPGISLIGQSDNLIGDIFNNQQIFDNYLSNTDKERLLKDALALSQDIYVINAHSENFYHTHSYSLGKAWYLVNNLLDVDKFPLSVKAFCNEIKQYQHNFNNYKSGLGSAVFVCNFFGNMYYVAYVFEGTNLDGLNDAGADFEQGLTGKTPQYQQAMYNTKLIVNAFNHHLKSCGKLYLFGHSLGGGLANAAALANSLPAITFNAASLHPDYVSQYATNYKKKTLAGIYVEGEILSTKLSKSVGLPKTGERYKVQLTGAEYSTTALQDNGKFDPFHYSSIRKHMLEPLCAKYKLNISKWDKKNKI